MPVLERCLGARGLGTLILGLFLALMLGTSVRAATPSHPTMEPILTAASPSKSMPMAGTPCLDCAACAVAPAPSAQGLSCDGKPDEQPRPAWPEQVLLPARSWFFDTGDARLRWPVRIAFCRWLD